MIGENEAGKTNLLLPLWKFNPTSDGEISLLDDIPRSEYSEMVKTPEDFKFIECEFDLNDAERKICRRYGADEDDCQSILVGRKFDGRWTLSLKPNTANVDFNKKADDEENKTLWKELERRLPKFIYYSNYGNLDGRIYLPRVVEDLKRSDLDFRESSKLRTIKVLFDMVSLDIDEVFELGNTADDRPPNQRNLPKTPEQIEQEAQAVNERAVLLSSAGTRLTKDFRTWWQQGQYKFRLHIDNQHFQIFVSDELRTDELELENRSAGLQWFFSFFLVFLYETEDAHRNAILLLDEPGLSLHPLAQRNLTHFFEGLAESNQILFTSHSPFLIDADRLDRVRKVFVNAEGHTECSADLSKQKTKLNEKPSGAAYAVHSALNLNVAESLLIGCRPIVVEGPSDQHYLTAIKSFLISKGKIKPSAELVFPPAGGAKTIKIIAGILMGRDGELPIVMMDDDHAGKTHLRTLEKDLYQNDKEKLLSVAKFSGLDGSEIEDLIEPSSIAKIVDRMHSGDFDPFEDEMTTSSPIVPQIQNWANANGIDLADGWKVQLSIRFKEMLFNGKLKPTDEEITKWTSLFKALG